MGGLGELFEKKYRLGRLLGRGGMGVVQAATHVYLQREVAIKKIQPEGTNHVVLTHRLLREARTLAALDHPNIVRIHDCDITKAGEIYLVMDLLSGDTLAELIERAASKNREEGGRLEKALETDFVITIAVQIAEALDSAHGAGICHRDLKPENVIVDEGGVPRVLDFGLAKDMQTPANPAKPAGPTNPLNIAGTPRYMAPEQIKGEPLDGRCDIYALGLILYQALSGHTPFDQHEDEATTDMDLFAHHLHAEPRPIQELVPDCPKELWKIILRCLAKNPDDRFQTAGELATALRAALKELVPAAPSVAAVFDAQPQAQPECVDDDPVVRETAPAPPPGAIEARPVLPFETPEPPRPLGKGHTERMIPSAATLMARGKAPTAAPPRLPAPRGKGYTERMIPSAATLLARGEGPTAAHPVPPTRRGRGYTERMVESAATLMARGMRPTTADPGVPRRSEIVLGAILTRAREALRSVFVGTPPLLRGNRAGSPGAPRERQGAPASTTGLAFGPHPTPPDARAPQRPSPQALAGRRTPPYYLAPIGGLAAALMAVVGVIVVRTSSDPTEAPSPAGAAGSTAPPAGLPLVPAVTMGGDSPSPPAQPAGPSAVSPEPSHAPSTGPLAPSATASTTRTAPAAEGSGSGASPPKPKPAAPRAGAPSPTATWATRAPPASPRSSPKRKPMPFPELLQ